jgi:invasion protein IalB
MLRKCVLLVTAGLIFAAAADGEAQQSPQPVPNLDWVKLCDKIEVSPKPTTEGETQPNQTVNVCRIFREVLHPTLGNLWVSAAIIQRDDDKGETLQLLVPLGVDLRSALLARIDAGKPLTLTYARCLPGGCLADIKLNPETTKAMRTGQQLVLETKGPAGKPIDVGMSLAGFAKAYDGNPSDAKAYQEARQQVAEFIRARRAEQIGKALQEVEKQEQKQQSSQAQTQQPQPPAASPPLEVVVPKRSQRAAPQP